MTAIPPAGASPHNPRRLLWALALAVGLAWAWPVHFWPHFHAANEAIRLYFIQAVVEEGRPELDGIVRRHGSVPVDRSEYRGHVYMDKAPGLSMLALPLYPAVRALRPAVAHRDLWLFGYIACLVAVALPLLASLAVMHRSMTSQGISPRHAVWTVLAVALASPVFIYATLFFGHGLATAAVGAGLFLLAARPAGRASLRRRLAAGLLLGFGGFVDTPVFVLAALGCLYSAGRPMPKPEESQETRATTRVWARVCEAGPVVAGVAVWSVAQLAYNAWVLGDPLRFTYQFKGDTQLAEIMAQGVLGFRPPDPAALFGLWLGSQRGLLYHSPWLGLALAGHVVAVTRRDLPADLRANSAWMLGITAAYSLLVAGFADWPAGDSAGARHLLPIVPLGAAGLGPLLAFARRPWVGRVLVPAAIAAGVLATAPTVATFPYHFHQLDKPMLELAWPLVVTGHLSPTLGRLAGWGDVVSGAVFVALLTAPWLLAARLPQPAGSVAPLRPGIAAFAAAAVLVVWATALMATVGQPGRAVQVARFRASQLLIQPMAARNNAVNQ